MTRTIVERNRTGTWSALARTVAITLLLLGLATGVAFARGHSRHGVDRSPDMHGGRITGPMNGNRMMPGRMHDGMHDRMNGEMHAFQSEAEYLATMSVHHQEAIERAEELLAITERPEMTALLESIIREQRAEIRFIEHELAERHSNFDTAAAAGTYEPMMSRLSGLDPDDADYTFLVEMIPHHMHAVMMSNRLLRHGGIESEAVAELARSIVDSQRSEIHTMRDYLIEWYDTHPGRGYRSDARRQSNQPARPGRPERPDAPARTRHMRGM